VSKIHIKCYQINLVGGSARHILRVAPNRAVAQIFFPPSSVPMRLAGLGATCNRDTLLIVDRNSQFIIEYTIKMQVDQQHTARRLSFGSAFDADAGRFPMHKFVSYVIFPICKTEFHTRKCDARLINLYLKPKKSRALNFFLNEKIIFLTLGSV
jgi:hypothetical protein